MKKYRFYCGTGFAGAAHEEVVELEDDVTPEEINDALEEWIWEHIEASWEAVEN